MPETAPRPFERRETVNWGDCDGAGIVFYPNFYRWADNCFHAMSRAAGFDQFSLMRDHGLLGTPLVETSARFVSPARPGDELTVAGRIVHTGRTSLALVYALTCDGRRIAEVREARVFVTETEDGLRPGAIPAEILASLAPWTMPE